MQNQPSGGVVTERCSKNTLQILGEHPCQSVISINFIEIILRHGSSPVNWLYIFRIPFLKKGSIISELQNRVTHYDITNRVTNSKTLFFLIFRVRNSM